MQERDGVKDTVSLLPSSNTGPVEISVYFSLSSGMIRSVIRFTVLLLSAESFWVLECLQQEIRNYHLSFYLFFF